MFATRKRQADAANVAEWGREKGRRARNKRMTNPESKRLNSKEKMTSNPTGR